MAAEDSQNTAPKPDSTDSADTPEATAAGGADGDASAEPLEGTVEPAAEAETAEDEPSDELLALREAASSAQDAALRAQAEMENVRRRAARDVENAHKFALERFAKDLIPVVESFQKADAARSEAPESADAVLEGVSLSLKLMLDVLEKQGVSQIDPHGEPFNPELHEAVAMVPAPHAEPNSVIEVVRRGFTLNGRLIQAAQVVVSQGEAPKRVDEQV